jgi:hypothetical protein
MKVGTVAKLANAAAIGVALILIWAPEIAANWVMSERVDEANLVRAYREPADQVLNEIARQQLGLPARGDTASEQVVSDILTRADRILAGQAQFYHQPAVAIDFPFRAANLDRGPPTHQLYMAGLGTVDVLLQAYRASGKEPYFEAATEELMAFSRADRYSLVPRGLLWNDHALANAVRVLVDFWRVARSKADFNRDAAREIMALAGRTAERLAKPGLFTYRTNHGVMQNLALLQFAAAFPWYAKASTFSELACRRLDTQLKYYVSPEGPILEHSAGYHEFGRNLLVAAIRLADLDGCVVPVEWREKMEKVRAFSATLRRPDGSLPVYGNTDYGLDARSPAEMGGARPPQAFGLFPISGVAVWWSGLDAWPNEDALSQTAVTWSNFPSRAHKLTDDLSIVVWARGVTWLGNTGYWPYGAAGFDQAHSWRGSNAPHFDGERDSVKRDLVLRGAGTTDRLQAIDLERRVLSEKSTFRRQVIAVAGTTWVVADSIDAQRNDAVERLWTTQPESEVRTIDDSTFLLVRHDRPIAARLSLLGDLSGAPEVKRGSVNPFAGWIVRDGLPLAAPSITVRQKAGTSLVFTVLEIGNESALSAYRTPRIVEAATSDRWELLLGGERPLTVSRSGSSVTAKFGDGSTTTASLDSVPVEPQRQQIIDAYVATEREYPRFKELVEFRYRVTWLALALVLLQEATLVAVRAAGATVVLSLRALASLSWVAFGLLAVMWYLN